MNFSERLRASIFFLLISINFAQDYSSKLSLVVNPSNDEYTLLNINNHGKYYVEREIGYDLEFKNLNTYLKINISNAYHKNKSFDFGESYLRHSIFKNTHIKIGKYYRDFSSYLNDDLSSGSMLISKNAQPIPKLGLLHKIFLKKIKIFL